MPGRVTVPTMVPFDCVHTLDVTAFLDWKARQEKRHDPRTVHATVLDLFPKHTKPPTMAEWLGLEARRVEKVRGSIPSEPTPGVRVWQDASGKVRFNPDMVCPAQQYTFPQVRPPRHKATTRGGAAALIRAQGRARRSGWSEKWWEANREPQRRMRTVDEADAINKKAIDKALGWGS